MKKRANPEIKRQIVFLRVPEELFAKIKKRASAIGISNPAYVLMILHEALEDKQKKTNE